MRVAVPAISFGQHSGLVKLLLERYPDAKVNTEGIPHYRSEQETIEYLDGYDAAIVSFEPINERVLERAAASSRSSSKLGVGLDKIDPAAMRRHGVRLGWTPGVNKRSVAELALCLAIAALAPRRRSQRRDAPRASGRCRRMGRQLTGRVVGIHGCGEIGKELVRLLHRSTAPCSRATSRTTPTSTRDHRVHAGRTSMSCSRAPRCCRFISP